MSDAPLCDCHGEPTRWVRDARRKAGGHWSCVVRRRESWRRYALTSAGLESSRAYKRSARGRAMTAEKNARRMFSGGVYLGTCGFTKAEREEMVRGATERP